MPSKTCPRCQSIDTIDTIRTIQRLPQSVVQRLRRYFLSALLITILISTLVGLGIGWFAPSLSDIVVRLLPFIFAISFFGIFITIYARNRVPVTSHHYRCQQCNKQWIDVEQPADPDQASSSG